MLPFATEQVAVAPTAQTLTGMLLLTTVLRLPSPPLALLPHASSVPSVRMAYESKPLSAIADTPCSILPLATEHGAIAPTAQTFAGTLLTVPPPVPVPSLAPVPPQARIVLSDLRASETLSP